MHRFAFVTISLLCDTVTATWPSYVTATFPIKRSLVELPSCVRTFLLLLPSTVQPVTWWMREKKKLRQ